MTHDQTNVRALIRMNKLTKSFRVRGSSEVTTAFAELDLELGAGEFVSLLGPSGCGKSTLLRCIAGLERPTSGELYYHDRPIKGPGAERGMVFQAYALFPWRTLRENIEFGPKARGVPPAERRAIAHRFIELVGLSGFEDRYPHELSGGMQQRGALARVFANDPETMLMDEPLAAVDAQTRDELQEELLELWTAVRRTIVFVTHSIDEAIFLSDRVVIMSPHPGRIHEVINITLPRPRNFETRQSDAYFAFVRRISSIMRTISPRSMIKSAIARKP